MVIALSHMQLLSSCSSLPQHRWAQGMTLSGPCCPADAQRGMIGLADTPGLSELFAPAGVTAVISEPVVPKTQCQVPHSQGAAQSSPVCTELTLNQWGTCNSIHLPHFSFHFPTSFIVLLPGALYQELSPAHRVCQLLVSSQGGTGHHCVMGVCNLAHPTTLTTS